MQVFRCFCLCVSLFSASALAGQESWLEAAGGNAGEMRKFLQAVEKDHGDPGKRAATFLLEGMPKGDLQSLTADFLLENLALAMKARKEFPWAKEVPEEVFFNDVLPYASLDETRERWRKEFYPLCAEIVKDCQTATEAAQALNRDFFNKINVHYNTGRKAPNQSPAESRKLGMATCTGLSIILVDACRAVGVPARIAGTPLWSNKRGNHTWVEVFDQGQWWFTGADEYNEQGLNRAWFQNDAAKAKAGDWRHAIWATSWRKTGERFPMVWDLESNDVPGVNVTARYAAEQKEEKRKAIVYLRLWEKEGGPRLAAPVEVGDGEGGVIARRTTKAGTTDLNDMPSVELVVGKEVTLQIRWEDEIRSRTLLVEKGGDQTVDLLWDGLEKGNPKLLRVSQWLRFLPEERHLSVPVDALSKQEAAEAVNLIWKRLAEEERAAREAELKAKVVRVGDLEMKYHERVFGEAPEGGRSLWISMHGGGGAPPQVNDQQWNNQIRLYAPDEGVVVAPRAPTDTWNLWHQAHIDDLFDRLIANFVMRRGVDPDRVFLLGYSAGGDGVYQLAPRMADRYAAAAMMAGHPNDAQPLGLRNLPFMIFMGGRDAAYKRNEVAAEWGEKLAALQAADEGGYVHKVTIYKELGHWMHGRDREALPWMAAHARGPWPKKLVWRQSGRTHDRFYWLAVPKGAARGGQAVRAEVVGQKISITSDDVTALTLRLSDALLDLDQEVVVTVNGKELYRGTPERKVESIWKSLRERMDPRSVATATLDLKWEAAAPEKAE